MPTPKITPEMYAELMAGQQDPQAGQVPPQAGQQEPYTGQISPQAGQIPPAQDAMAGQQTQQPAGVAPAQEPQAPRPEDIEEAKKLLGVDGLQNTLEQLVADRVKESVSAKYPDVPYDIVEKEIEKVAKIDPNFAKAMRTTPEGMEMAYRSAKAAYKPQEKPDNLTEGEGGGGQNDDPTEDLVRQGKADDFTLGNYILNLK